MFGPSFNERISVKVIRNGETDVSDNAWMEFSPAERIDAVWTLTKLCLAWNSDLPDELRLQRLLRIFNDHNVDYLLVGAHALAVYGHVRATKDLDVWVRPDPKNAERVLTSLETFGAPLGDRNRDDLSKPRYSISNWRTAASNRRHD